MTDVSNARMRQKRLETGVTDLAGGLLGVWNDITTGLVGAAADGVADLVDGGLGLVRSGFVANLCEMC